MVYGPCPQWDISSVFHRVVEPLKPQGKCGVVVKTIQADIGEHEGGTHTKEIQESVIGENGCVASKTWQIEEQKQESQVIWLPKVIVGQLSKFEPQRHGKSNPDTSCRLWCRWFWF